MNGSESLELAAATIARRAAALAAVGSLAALLTLLSADISSVTARTVVGFLIVAAPVSCIVAQNAAQARARFAAATVFLLAAVTIVCASVTDRAAEAFDGGLAALAYWSLPITAFACARALDDLFAIDTLGGTLDPEFASWRLATGEAAAPARSLASVVLYGASLSLCILIVASLADAFGSVLPLAGILARTPVHLAILFAFASGIALTAGAAFSQRVIERSSGAPEAWRDRIECEYLSQRQLLNTLIALLPVLGFLGTVLGIMTALATLPGTIRNGGPPVETGSINGLADSLAGIATAFETTLLGLVASIVGVLAIATLDRRAMRANGAVSSANPDDSRLG